jgi:hypothetical protein
VRRKFYDLTRLQQTNAIGYDDVTGKRETVAVSELDEIAPGSYSYFSVRESGSICVDPIS